METNPDQVREQWQEWARQLVGDDRPDEIAQAALDAMAAGADAYQAAAVSRIRAGRAAWADLNLLAQSRSELDSALRLTATLTPGPDLTPAALDEMRSQLSRRLAAITPAEAQGAAVATPTAAPPRPSLREYLAERSIQLLAYSGALLLAVATLLFDLSGTSPSRFFAVAALCLVFAVGGAFAARHESLRAVARAYMALAALLLPLVALAAYVFLGLGPAGVPSTLAVAISAGSCAATYVVLGRVLSSRAYAALSLLALAVFAGASAAWLSDYRWAGAAVAGLGVACALAASWRRSAREPFQLPLLAAGLVLPAAGVVWGLGWLYSFTGRVVADPPLSVALSLALAAYLVMAVRRRWLSTAAALWLAAAAFSAAHDLSLTSTQVQAVGAVVALIWLAAALPPLDERLRLGRETQTLLRLMAALLLMVISWPGSGSAGPQAALALVSTAALLTVAVRCREPPWLLAAGVVATAAWYWLAQALLPAKPNANTTDLAIVLSPLPVIFGAASLVLRQLLSRSWAWPLYACFAALGLGVVTVALVEPGWLVAGGCVLIYAAFGYTIAQLERQTWGLAVALLAALAGVGCLLAAENAKGDYYLSGLAGFGVVVYLIGTTMKSSGAGPVHRYLAQACLVLAAVASVFSAESPATIALCSVAATAVFGLDAWLRRVATSEYLAGLAASLLAVAMARQLNLTDLLYQVVVPGVALIGAGGRASTDERLPERILLARLATAAGCLLVFGTTAVLAGDARAAGDARSTHTAWLTVEAAAGMVAAVGLRSRTLAIASAIALGWAALMAVSLLAAVLPLSLIFGVVAVVLILVATGLALLRGSLGPASDSARTAWSSWV
jgi:hypothetical protein